MKRLVNDLRLINEEVSLLVEDTRDLDDKYVQKAIDRNKIHSILQYVPLASITYGLSAPFTYLIKAIRAKSAWKRTYAKYQKAKNKGNVELSKVLYGRLVVIKGKMAEADKKLKEKYAALTPEKKEEFNRKKSKIIAKVMQRENL